MEGNRKAEDKMNMVNVVTVGVVGVLLVWVSVVALQAYYKSTLEAEEQRRMTQNQDADLRKVQASQRAMLGDYAMRSSAAAGKKVAVIPIERAMELVLKDARTAPDKTLVPAIGAQDRATIHPFPPYEAIKAEPPPAAPTPPTPTPTPTPAPPAPVAPAGGTP